MQAIQTRFIGPTSFRGSRIKAFPRGITLSKDHALGVEASHDAAAVAFITSKEWFGVWVRGGSPDSKGYTYVCAARHHEGKNSHVKCKALAESIGDLCIYVTPESALPGAK